MEYALWNTLHDGSIEAIGGRVPGDLTLTVGIAYLCAKLPTEAKSLHVILLDCSMFTYTPFGDDTTTDLRGIAGVEPEIVSAVPHDICCAGGTLTAAYRAVEVRLMEGQLIRQPELEAAAVRYWSEWSERNKKA